MEYLSLVSAEDYSKYEAANSVRVSWAETFVKMVESGMRGCQAPLI